MKPSAMSADATDKMLACLNHVFTGSDYKMAPAYYDACARWWAQLSPEQQQTGQLVIDAHDGPQREAALGIAASLPPAPRYPF
jgi:hypothetical protein